MKHILTLTFLTVAFQISGISQITINEFSASNLNGFYDSFFKTEDWVELYNKGGQPMDISGWHLSDKMSKPGKWELPSGTIIQPEGFLRVYCSGRDGIFSGDYHSNFKLSQTTGKDIILLSDENNDIIEAHDLNITLVEHSNCRMTDGADQWMICSSPTPNYSNQSSSNSKYLGYTKAPSMDLEAGYYDGPQMITITNNEENSVLKYTIDGTNPTTTSSTYTGPISINRTTVIKAQAFSNDAQILTGKMEFNTYLIDEDYSLAVFSVAADDVIRLANGEGTLIPIGSIEYFNLDKEREATSFGSLNRHGQDSWVLDHRSLDWISRDEMGYSKAVDAPLFSSSDRDEYQKFMFRNSGDDNYPAINDGAHEGSTHIRDEFVHTLSMEGGLKLDQRAVERVVLFLNGQYWGVYGMRERPVDHDYTKEYYDQGKYDIQYLSTWGGTEIEYGGQKAQDDWIALRNFILYNDMSGDENYAIVDDSINLVSLIDYMVVNLNVVASDWLNYNTGWWRGLDPEGDHKKWGYILWDLDATFDYYINYTGVPNTNPDAVPCSLEDISDYMDLFFGNQGPNLGDVGRHEKIFLKLLEENETFKQLYYSRYADIMNTIFTCENMNKTLDRMLDVIRPEMPRQIQRWGGSMTEWESNVQQLKNFINARCTLLDDGMIDCYEELSGPYEVTLLTQPTGMGEIDFNTLDIESFPWTGDYFGGMENKIKAKVFKDYEDEYEFSHWVSKSGNEIFPNVDTRKATITLTGPDTLIAVFDQITVGVEELGNEYDFALYPNPANEYLVFNYSLESNSTVKLSLHTILGEQVISFKENSGDKGSGNYSEQLDLSAIDLNSGLYIFVVDIDNRQRSFKVNIIR